MFWEKTRLLLFFKLRFIVKKVVKLGFKKSIFTIKSGKTLTKKNQDFMRIESKLLLFFVKFTSSL